MQKWLPDAFAEDAVVVGLKGQAGTFESETETSDDHDSINWTSTLFRGEADFADPDTLLAHLTQQERDLICRSINQEIADEIAVKEGKQAEEFAAKLADMDRQHTENFVNWGKNFQEAMAVHLGEGSAAAARLAIQLAERIIRAKVELDPDILARAIEMTLFKIVDGSQIDITVHPADAEYFRNNPQTLNHLHIKDIQEDRRMERGGCLVHAGNLEWDATLTSQLETLGQVVEEAIAVNGAAPEQPVPAEPDQGDGEAHDSGLE